MVEYARAPRHPVTGTDPLTRAFGALADPTRRDMVVRLAEADATPSELAAHYEVSLQAVSKHLKVLEESGLVTRGRDAQRRPAHLEAEVLDLMTKWIERYRRQAEERYRRLEAVLAAMPDDPPEGPGPSHPIPPDHPEHDQTGDPDEHAHP